MSVLLADDYPELSGFYWAQGKLWIIADRPNASALSAKCPDLPSLNLKDLEHLITRE